jgi:hypothetical protein
VSESTTATLTSVPGTFLVSLVVGIAVLGLAVLVFVDCHDRLSRRELIVPANVRSSWQRFGLMLLALVIGGRGQRHRGQRWALGRRWLARCLTACLTVFLSMQIAPTRLDEAGHAISAPPPYGDVTASQSAPATRPALPGTVLMSAKDGLAAGLAWCWGGAAVVGSVGAAAARLLLAYADYGDNRIAGQHDVSAFACGWAMTLTAFLMMLARYLYEVRQQDAVQAILDPPAPAQTTGPALSRVDFLPIPAHPIDRLPRWALVMLLGAGASIGSQVVSGIIWIFEALNGRVDDCSAPRVPPLLLDPICDAHPTNLLLRFTTENTLSYLGVNTLAFFVIAYILLPREGQSLSFGARSVSLVIGKLFDRASPDGAAEEKRRSPRFRPWLDEVGIQPAAPAGSLCGLVHVAKGKLEAKGVHSEFMTSGKEGLLAHVVAAHQEVLLFGGVPEDQRIVLTMFSEALRKGRPPHDGPLAAPRFRAVSHSPEAAQANIRPALDVTFEAFPGRARRLVVVVDPALSCGATYVAHSRGHSHGLGDATAFSVYLHRENSRVVAIHEAIEQLLEFASPAGAPQGERSNPVRKSGTFSKGEGASEDSPKESDSVTLLKK